MEDIWKNDRDLKQWGFDSELDHVTKIIDNYRKNIMLQKNITNLFTLEGRVTQDLYALAVRNTKYNNGNKFTRDRKSLDKANVFLSHGNYLAYGLGATATWVLGIPHAFAVMHGKTRRGALVFDIADIVKDTLVLPLAFICATENVSEQEFRQECINYFTKHEALDEMIKVIKVLALDKDDENNL